jgi:glycosyltransferase involved in cell wall biosynthesis
MTATLDREDVHPWRIRGLGRAIRVGDDLDAVRHLVREFRAFRPHIVHTHTAKAGALGRVAAWICRVPVVVHTFHGHVFEGYFSPPIAQAFIAIERLLARGTDQIVTISPRQHADITARYRIAPPERVTVLPLGFDLGRFEAPGGGTLRAELGIAGAPLIASVGRLTRIKDQALLLKAFQLLEDETVHLCLVGGGELEGELRALAQELSVLERTHFLGFRDDLAGVLADADVVALTSVNEGTPVALIEALAAGCSTVAIDVGGVADVLEEGRWGSLVASREPAEFARALGRALTGHRTRGWGEVEAGKAYVRSKYGIGRLVSDHEVMYRGLLSRTLRPRRATENQ